ncbi:unnamed protein product [Strongylus vulgaris]|uniref:Uncharacterized protein n=1 Tax=Strongylus vulgaris TaxID=40348 RepID=A0A3P7K8I0_STRVU|nr:unnamed protein product [Strongylus vulgaris]
MMGNTFAAMLARTPQCNGGFDPDDIEGEVAIVKKNGVTKTLNGAEYRYGLGNTLL